MEYPGRAGIDTGSRLRHNASIYKPDLIFTNPLVDGKPMMDFDKPNDWQDRFTGKTRSEFLDPSLGDKWAEEQGPPSPKDVTLESMKINPKTHGGSGVRAFTKKRAMGIPALPADRSLLGTVPAGFKQTMLDQGVDGLGYAPNVGETVETDFGKGVVNESGQVETGQGTVIQIDGVNNNQVIQKPTQQESTSSGGKG